MAAHARHGLKAPGTQSRIWLADFSMAALMHCLNVPAHLQPLAGNRGLGGCCSTPWILSFPAIELVLGREPLVIVAAPWFQYFSTGLEI